MGESSPGRAEAASSAPHRLRRLLALSALGWTAVVAASLAWNFHLTSEGVVEMARREAEAVLQTDIAYKRWAASQGGVYVRVTKELGPDPFLAHVPDRDVDTQTGEHLTLMNPATLVMRVRASAEEPLGIRGRITSTNPAGPESVPDEWERGALVRLEQGSMGEIWEVVPGEGDRYLRAMRRLVIEERCLKCHAFQGYDVGDMRGGVAVQIPLTPYRAEKRAQDAVLAVGHGALWILGLGVLLVVGRRSVGRAEERERSAAALREAETELLHARKLEAVGRLAGGLAHDINNLLTPILGYAAVASEEVPPGTPLREDLDQIRFAAERARDITRRLLAFGRRAPLTVVPLDVSEVVAGMETMLRRLIGEQVAFETSLATGLPAVDADRAQLEVAIVNLALNARDAMPQGGTLRIATAEETLAAPELDARPGRYVSLTITDTGVGMDPEVLERVFEPFFTTKPAGQGTGLGLATVHGVVRQHGGTIRVTSEPGSGTTFRILLPVTAEPPVKAITSAPSAEPAQRGTETVLVVEDDAGVRHFVGSALASLGYRVLSAGDGDEALRVGAAHQGAIDLLLTDVVMPRMSGRELAERFAGHRPGMGVVYMSGYTGDIFEGAAAPGPAGLLLKKPFTPAELSSVVRRALDARM